MRDVRLQVHKLARRVRELEEQVQRLQAALEPAPSVVGFIYESDKQTAPLATARRR